MPYTAAQLRKFAVMAKEGKKVPADWKKYAKQALKGKSVPKKRRKK